MRHDAGVTVKSLSGSAVTAFWFPFLVLAVSLASTYFVWNTVEKGIRERAEAHFREGAEEIVSRIVKRLDDNEQILLGGNALFNIKGRDTTRDDWRQYVSGLKLDIHQPGILGFGYTAWLLPSEKDAHIRKVRAEGFPDYTIRPEGERPAYTSITWLEPFSEVNRRAFGYDMYSEPVRRAAMEKARDTGMTSITGKVTLVQETDKNRQSGMLMYLPSYSTTMPTETVEQRRGALRGFVYSPIRMNDFIYGTLNKLPSDVDFEIHAGTVPTDENLLFSSRQAEHRTLPEGYRPTFSTAKTVDAYGVPWHFTFSTLPPFDKSFSHEKARATLFGGILTSLLLTGLAFMQVRSRRQALTIADQMAQQAAVQQKLALHVQQTPLAVIEWDPSFRVTAWNRAAESIFGYPAAEAIGVHASFIVPENVRDHVNKVLQALLQGTGSARSVNQNIRKDGRIIECEWYNTGLVDKNGTVMGIASLAQDITERLHGERALRHAVEYGRSLIEANLDPLVTITPEGTISDVNLASMLATGRSREEMIGTDFSSYFTDPDKAQAGYKQVFYKGMIRDYPLEIRHRDGRVTPVLYNASVFLDETGAVAGVFAAARDITELKQAEQELRESRDAVEAANSALYLANSELMQHRDHLEELVNARTRELAAARDAAESASRAKSAFLSTMGHELRTPMNHIIGMGYLLAKELTHDREKERLAKIQHSSRHLLGLINDILDYSRSESDLIQIEAVDFNLAALLEHVENGSREHTTAKGLELVSEIAPDLPPWLKGDPVRLRQILENLLSNAVKFSEQGRIMIRARLSEVRRNDLSVRFEVEDQGIGMSPEQQAGMFQLFNQGDNSSTRQYGGTGLGLALCRRLVSLMAGEIGVTSALGQGSTFWFTLRLEAGAAPASGTTGTVLVDRKQVSDAVTYLENLLGDDDAEALVLWDESRQLLEPLLEGRLDAFAEAMEGFDFETARQLLREALAANPELS